MGQRSHKRLDETKSGWKLSHHRLRLCTVSKFPVVLRYSVIQGREEILFASCLSKPTPMQCSLRHGASWRAPARRLSLRPQSQRPSFQPVRHRSSHLEQSKVGFPSLRLTSLCASHSQLPNSARLPTFGASRFMYVWKSSAQTQQGYRREKSRTKLKRSDCCVDEGASG
jgi:hypothetical protein